MNCEAMRCMLIVVSSTCLESLNQFNKGDIVLKVINMWSMNVNILRSYISEKCIVL